MHRLRVWTRHLQIHLYLLWLVICLSVSPGQSNANALIRTSKQPNISSQDYAQFKHPPRKKRTIRRGSARRLHRVNKTTWEKLKGLFIRKGKEAGTRGQQICSVTPNKALYFYRSWSNRPLFTWLGSMKSIELHLPGSHNRAEPLWHYQPQDNESSVLYNGEYPLQRGQQYVYRFEYTVETGQKTHSEYGRLFFKISDKNEYERINKELEEKGLLLINGINNSEDIILEKALYFIERELYLDAIKEIYLMPLFLVRADRVQELKELFCEHYKLK